MRAIQTLGLTKIYPGGAPACDHINLTVNQGEIFGLLGPNGAGKSTLVKMLVGLTHPTAGSARVLGFSFRELAPRRRLGYLPELFRYPPWLKAQEVLDFHARLLRVPMSREERQGLLRRVGLEAHGGERVRRFSKGMQQRLGIAAALVGHPELVILDEPTSALDPIGRHEVSQLLRELKQAGVTVFLNSHLLSDVEKVCDSVALIDKGRVLYQGFLQEALYGGVRRYRLRLGALDSEMKPRVQALFPAGMIQWSDSGETEMTVALMRQQLPDLISQLVGLGASVYEVEPDHLSLEDWFLQRLGKGNL